jgi:hypothetical protein
VRTSEIRTLMLILALGIFTSALVQSPTQAQAERAAVPYPTAATPGAIDRGELSAQSGTVPISVTCGPSPMRTSGRTDQRDNA